MWIVGLVIGVGLIVFGFWKLLKDEKRRRVTRSAGL